MMKRNILLLLLLLFIVLLASCHTDANTTSSAESLNSQENDRVSDHLNSPTGGEIPNTTQMGEGDALFNISEPTVTFSTYPVNEKYYNDTGNSYVELDLLLPEFAGDYEGLEKINRYFADREAFFYGELPLEFFDEISANMDIRGKESNYFRSAYYKFEAQVGDIISISADLDGGEGGAGWEGIEGDVFNLHTGEKLLLSDLFAVDQEAYMAMIYDYISESITMQINEAANSGYGSPFSFDNVYAGDGYAAIREHFDPDHFYLTDSGLVIIYPKYALTTGAAGPLELEIPYQYLSDILTAAIRDSLAPRTLS